jgi:hypothetical protein
MKPRYRPRIPFKLPVVFTAGAQIGEGRILDLTIPGCLIESPVTVQADESVQLKIHLPGLKRPLTVGLGVVRWTNGKQFGVEFIRMEESQGVLLRRFMAQHVSDLAPAKTKQNAFYGTGGQQLAFGDLFALERTVDHSVRNALLPS